MGEAKSKLEDVEGSGIPLFIGILLEYEYANNKHGEYGVIYDYVVGERFAIQHEWIK